MRLILSAAIASSLVLAGCASPTGEGQAHSDGLLGPGTGPQTEAASLGNGKWMISCFATIGACTWRAQQVCPTGFDTQNNSGTEDGYLLTIACKP